MTAAVAGGDCPLALQMHQRLRSAGLRPDGLTYTVLIQVGGAPVAGRLSCPVGAMVCVQECFCGCAGW